MIAIFNVEEDFEFATELVAHLLNPLEGHFLVGPLVYCLEDVPETSRPDDSRDGVIGEVTLVHLYILNFEIIIMADVILSLDL
jgi:hypothetical protein